MMIIYCSHISSKRKWPCSWAGVILQFPESNLTDWHFSSSQTITCLIRFYPNQIISSLIPSLLFFILRISFSHRHIFGSCLFSHSNLPIGLCKQFALFLCLVSRDRINFPCLTKCYKSLKESPPQLSEQTVAVFCTWMHRQERSAHCCQTTSSLPDDLLSQRHTVYSLQWKCPTSPSLPSLMALMWFPKVALALCERIALHLHSRHFISQFPLLVVISCRCLIEQESVPSPI